MVLPSGNPTRTRESEVSEGRGVRDGAAPPRLPDLLQRPWNKGCHTQRGPGTLPLPSPVLRAV